MNFTHSRCFVRVRGVQPVWKGWQDYQIFRDAQAVLYSLLLGWARLNSFPMVEILLEKTKTVIAWSQLPARSPINLFVSNCKMYLSQIAKCIWDKGWNPFGKDEESDSLKSVARPAPQQFICLKLPNVFVSNCKMYVRQRLKSFWKRRRQW